MWLFIFYQLLLSCLSVDCQFSLWTRLVHFQNPEHVDVSWQCCERVTSNCRYDCQTKFTICISTISQPERCIYKRFTTDVHLYGDDVVFFKGYSNPFITKLAQLQDIYFEVKAETEDGRNIGNFNESNVNLPITSSTNQSVVEKNYEISRRRYESKKLKVEFRLFCQPFYMLPDCQLYCKPHNDGLFGHYKCDSQLGKVCLDGWIEPSTNCTKLNETKLVKSSVHTPESIKLAATPSSFMSATLLVSSRSSFTDESHSSSLLGLMFTIAQLQTIQQTSMTTTSLSNSIINTDSSIITSSSQNLITGSTFIDHSMVNKASTTEEHLQYNTDSIITSSRQNFTTISTFFKDSMVKRTRVTEDYLLTTTAKLSNIPSSFISQESLTHSTESLESTTSELLDSAPIEKSQPSTFNIASSSKPNIVTAFEHSRNRTSSVLSSSKAASINTNHYPSLSGHTSPQREHYHTTTRASQSTNSSSHSHSSSSLNATVSKTQNLKQTEDGENEFLYKMVFILFGSLFVVCCVVVLLVFKRERMKEKQRIQCQSQYELSHSEVPLDDHKAHSQHQHHHHESVKAFTEEEEDYDEDENVNVVRFDHIEDHLPQNLLESKNGTYIMNPPPNVPTTFV